MGLYTDIGVPEKLAQRLAGLGPLYASLDIVTVARERNIDETKVGNVYFLLGDELGVQWLRDQIERLPVQGRWQAMARNSLRENVYRLQRNLSARILESGGHRKSVAAVREGRADVAAIDCVTYANLQAAAPREVKPLRVIGLSASAPALPYITRRDISPEDLQRLRAGLHAAIADPTLAETRAAMLIAGIEIVPLRAYDRMLEMEREADQARSMVIA